MFILKKLFKLRDNGDHTSDIEKPFLEHLEDLRDVVFKVVITLLVATIICYVFRSTLMDLLRRPIERVWTEAQITKLPSTISPDLWEQAKKVADATRTFTPEQQSAYYDQFEDEKLRKYANTATYYRAVLLIEDPDKRQAFIENFPQTDEDTRTLLTELIKKEPSAAVNAKGDVVFMRSLKPTETFMLAIKLSLFAGIIISFPLLLYFILQFVLPGLKENERKALWPALIVGFGLFLLGVVFCYFVVLPKALDFFYTYSGGMGVENEWRIGDYITFTTQFTLIFGLAFELPVVVMTLVKLGMLSYQTMSNTRSYAVLTIFVVGAVITPTGDALTLSLLAAPMCLLYEMCIWLAYFHNKKELEREAQEDADISAYRDRLEDGEYDDDHDDFLSDEDKPRNDRFKTEDGIPVPVPVPGRISTEDEGHLVENKEDPHANHIFDDDEDHFDEGHLEDDDYDEDGHFDEDHFDEDGYDEGDEFDDGELEDFSETIKALEEKLDQIKNEAGIKTDEVNVELDQEAEDSLVDKSEEPDKPEDDSNADSDDQKNNS